MSELTKMNLIAIVQQLPDEDIEFVQQYITILEDKLQQKENIIKEVREFIIENMGYYSERLEYKEYTERYVKDLNKIIKLLDNGEDE